MQNSFNTLLIGLNIINVPQYVAYQRTGEIVGRRFRVQKSGRDLQGTATVGNNIVVTDISAKITLLILNLPH